MKGSCHFRPQRWAVARRGCTKSCKGNRSPPTRYRRWAFSRRSRHHQRSSGNQGPLGVSIDVEHARQQPVLPNLQQRRGRVPLHRKLQHDPLGRDQPGHLPLQLDLAIGTSPSRCTTPRPAAKPPLPSVSCWRGTTKISKFSVALCVLRVVKLLTGLTRERGPQLTYTPSSGRRCPSR